MKYFIENIHQLYPQISCNFKIHIIYYSYKVSCTAAILIYFLKLRNDYYDLVILN